MTEDVTFASAESGAARPASTAWLRSWHLRCHGRFVVQVPLDVCQTAVMKSPWKAVGVLAPDAEYVVLASSIPPKSLASTWSLFRGSRAVRQQLLTTDGLLGFSMLAEPLRKNYATLSVWRDEEALDAFAGSSAHARLMAELAPAMNEPRFVRWTIPGSDGTPSWTDALSRLF